MSAVATILGLLLVVTFIANYLGTVLPNRMTVNDLNRELAVENQLSTLSTLLERLAQAGAVGAQVSQPISLGSDSVPPFAASDGSILTPVGSGPNISSTISAVGARYNPPTGYPAGGTYDPSCTQHPAPPANATSIDCTGQKNSFVTYGFVGSGIFSVNGTGGTAFTANVTANNSIVYLNGSGGGGSVFNQYVNFVGSHDNIFVAATGSANQVVNLVGNYDNLTLSETSKGTMTVTVVGNHDHIFINGVANDDILIVAWGAYDSVAATSGNYNVYFNGFDPLNATALGPTCPYGNLATTDTVSGGKNTSGSTYNVTFNTTNQSGLKWVYPWKEVWIASSPISCVFFAGVFHHAAPATTAVLEVQFRNAYAPNAVAAFDEGAVVAAQPGGLPIMLAPPWLSLSRGTLTLTLPSFVGTFASEAGTGTAVVSLRLVSLQQFIFPSSSFVLLAGSPVVLSIITPFAYAWKTYLTSALPGTVGITCTVGGIDCSKVGWQSTGPLGVVTVSIPSALVSSLTVTVAQFAVSSR